MQTRALGLTISLFAVWACGPTSVDDDPSDADGSSTSDPVPGTSSEAGDETEQGSSSGGGESSETGELPPEPETTVAMLVHRYDASGWQRFFRYRDRAGVADGPFYAHEATEADWQSAVPLSDHRVAYRVSSGTTSELRLGTLDDPLPAETQPLNVPPAPPEVDWRPAPIPGQDAIVYPGGDTLWRVDLDGLAPSAPVAVAHLKASVFSDDAYDVDPLGRYVVFLGTEDAAGTSNLARASLTAPDPDGVELLTDLSVDGSVSLPVLAADGGSGLFVESDLGVATLMHVDLAQDGLGPAVPVSDPVFEPEHIWFSPIHTPVRPHPDAHGIALAIGEDSISLRLAYAGVEDGVGLPPVELHDPAVSTTALSLHQSWTPDGRWLAFETSSDDGRELSLAHLGDGQTPVVTSIATYDGSDEDYAVYQAPDSQHVYLVHRDPGTLGEEILRIELTDAGPMDPQLVAPAEGAFLSLWDFSSDAAMLLYSVSPTDAEEILLYGIDVSGAEPGDPVQLNAPLAPGYWAQFAAFSPGDMYIGYIERNDIFGEKRLMLVHRDSPEQAVEVSEPIIGWQFVPEW